MSDIYSMSKDVRSKADFELFMQKLQEDYVLNQDVWENNQLESYLQGLLGYILDTPFEDISWGVLSEALLAARVYE